MLNRQYDTSLQILNNEIIFTGSIEGANNDFYLKYISDNINKNIFKKYFFEY